MSDECKTTVTLAVGWLMSLCTEKDEKRSYLDHCPAPLYEPLLIREMGHTAAQDQRSREQEGEKCTSVSL